MTKRDPRDRAASGDSPGAPASEVSPGSSSKQKQPKRTKKSSSRSSPATDTGSRVIAIANQKGGVGKSTTAVSLGAALAELGQRVLVIDLDPQGNASTGLGIKHESRDVTVYDVLATEAPITEAIIQTPTEGLAAIPSTIDLAGAEIELVSQFSRELRLRKAIEPLKEDSYDFIFLDCPPSLGLLTVNALAAAQELIVPIQCEYYALEGLGQLLHNVRLVQQNINMGLRLTGIVMTMFDSRTKLSEQVVDEVRRYFGDRVYDVIIPRTVRLSEAPGFGQPITTYDPKSKGAETYRLLAKEVLEKPLPEGEAMPQMEDLPKVILPVEGESARSTQPTSSPDDEDEEPEPEGSQAVSEPADPARTASGPETADRGSTSVAADAERPAAGIGDAATEGSTQATTTPEVASPPAKRSETGSPSASYDAVTREAPREDPPPRRAPSGREQATGSQTPVEQDSKEQGASPPQGPAQRRPATVGASTSGERNDPSGPRGRRVVVIDERAEEAAVLSGQERPVRTDDVDPGAAADIGERLPQEPARKKKRWWQLGKGGEV
ncbi:MAG: AAA family ATPase [Actinomycetota bacterium]